MAMTSHTEGRAGGGLGAGPSPPGVPRALCACARTGARITKRTSRSASFSSTPARGGQLGCRLGRETARQAKRHNTGKHPGATVSPACRSVDNGGVMAWVEIEAGPFLVTAAITRDAMEELALAPRRRGDGRREGDFRDDQAHLRRSIWASRMRPTCGLVIGAPSVPIRLPATASRGHPFVWDQRTRCGSRRQTRDSRWGGLNPRRSTVSHHTVNTGYY